MIFSKAGEELFFGSNGVPCIMAAVGQATTIPHRTLALIGTWYIFTAVMQNAIQLRAVQTYYVQTQSTMFCCYHRSSVLHAISLVLGLAKVCRSCGTATCGATMFFCQ